MRWLSYFCAAALITTTTSISAAESYRWHPEKDADGRVLASSVQSLEPDTWYEVEGTDLTPLLAKIQQATGKTYNQLNQGNGKINKTFNSWVAGDLGDDGKFYVPWGGGHSDSSLNGVWALNIERMGGDDTWEVAQAPSDPDKPGFEWSQRYRKSGDFTAYHPKIMWPNDILPDGMPTSRHQYNGVWFDSKRGTINQSRGHLWTFNTRTGETSGKVWKVGGKTRFPGIYGNLWYNEFHDTVIGHLRYKRYSRNDFIRYHPDTHKVELHGGTPWTFNGSTCGTRVDDQILFLGYEKGARWAFYDLKKESMRRGKFKGVKFDWKNEMPVCVYVPAWNKVLRRMQQPQMQGKWSTFDLDAKTEASYKPKGKIPPYDRYPGKKVFYYAPWKAVIYITTTGVKSNAIYVMRTG